MRRSSTRRRAAARGARGKSSEAGGTADALAGEVAKAIEPAAITGGDGRKSGRNKWLSVCLLSQHELALAEFRAWLAGDAFRVKTVPIPSTVISELRRLPLPGAELYAVDAHAPRAATETLIAGILERFPGARVLVMGREFHEADAFPLLGLGVKGLVNYAQGPQDLPRALLHVATGAYWVPRDLLSRFVDSILSGYGSRLPLKGVGRLSRREQQVLETLLENLSNKEIACQLHISERTAKFHVSNLLEKFGVRRRADLILLHYQQQPAQ